MKFIDVVSAVILCIVLYGAGNLGKQAVIKDVWKIVVDAEQNGTPTEYQNK